MIRARVTTTRPLALARISTMPDPQLLTQSSRQGCLGCIIHAQRRCAGGVSSHGGSRVSQVLQWRHWSWRHLLLLSSRPQHCPSGDTSSLYSDPYHIVLGACIGEMRLRMTRDKLLVWGTEESRGSHPLSSFIYLAHHFRSSPSPHPPARKKSHEWGITVDLKVSHKLPPPDHAPGTVTCLVVRLFELFLSH